MPTPWVTNTELLTGVAHFIGCDDIADLAPRWTTICARANALSQAELTGVLAAKGYSAATIAAWDFKRDYVLDYGIYLAICKGQPDKAAEAEPLNRKKELEAAAVIIAGGSPVGPASPADTDVGGIGYGTTTTRRDELEEEARRKGWFS